MNVGLRSANTMHAIWIFHEIVSQNTQFITSIISFSSVLDVSVSGVVCSLILTIHHSLELLANCSYTIELISIQTMSLPSSIYATTTWLFERTLIELVNPYPHTPITMQVIGIPGTTGLGFWTAVVCSNFFTCNFSLNADYIAVSETDNHQDSHRATICW